MKKREQNMKRVHFYGTSVSGSTRGGKKYLLNFYQNVPLCFWGVHFKEKNKAYPELVPGAVY